MDRLLDPESGCPWDLKQTPASIGSYILEETYELLGAIEADNPDEIVEELGDCLFLLGFLAKIFEGRRLFNLKSALDAANAKMISRHPHVFGETAALTDAEQVRAQWHEIKRKEKPGSVLGTVPQNLPSLLRTHRLTERAGRVGFDWPGAEAVLATLDDEISELTEALAAGNLEMTSAELGDVLFTLANLGRHLKINAEESLRLANSRFVKRFQYIEEELAKKGRSPEEASLEEMDRLWDEAKSRGL